MASLVDEQGFNQGFKLTVAQRVRLRRRAEAIAREWELPSALAERRRIQVLELGCGTGELAAELATLTNTTVTGVDVSPSFVARAAELHHIDGLTFALADVRRPPAALVNRRYDYVVGNGILHHLYHELGPFLTAANQWLRPGGKLVFWEPNLANPYIFAIFSFARLRQWARLEPDEMAFSAQHALKLLRDAGYTNVRVDTRDFLLPNTPTPLVGAIARMGEVAERVPIVRLAAQSLFIRAQSPRAA